MLKSSNRDQLWIVLALGTLMLVTRGQHVSAFAHPLPDASLAIFFLAGFYLRPAWIFGALFAEGLLIDLAAVTWGGVSGFCMSPAYLLLVPAYGAMWAGGRWYAGRHRGNWSTVLPLVGSLLVTAIIAEVFASGGFYLFSGRFADLSLAEFGVRLIRYFPTTLQALAIYVGLTAIVHWGFAYLRSGSRQGDLTAG